MKTLFVFILSLSALCSISSFAGDGGLAGENEPKLSQLTGVYRGFAPTDESALMIGEIEVTISKDKIAIRMATGLEIQTGELALDGFEPMTRAEIERLYSPESPYPGRSFGFKDPSGYPQLVFLQNPSVDQNVPGKTEYGVIVKTGGMQDLLGPTILLTPAQLEIVSCEQFLGSIEFLATGNSGVIPRLRTGGRAPQGM